MKAWPTSSPVRLNKKPAPKPEVETETKPTKGKKKNAKQSKTTSS